MEILFVVLIVFFICGHFYNQFQLAHLRRKGLYPKKDEASIKDVLRLKNAGFATWAIRLYREIYSGVTLKNARDIVHSSYLETNIYLIKSELLDEELEVVSLLGNGLYTPLSIVTKKGNYFVISSKCNVELISFLDKLNYLSNKTLKKDGYYWWGLDSSHVIALLNDVMRNFYIKIDI